MVTLFLDYFDFYLNVEGRQSLSMRILRTTAYNRNKDSTMEHSYLDGHKEVIRIKDGKGHVVKRSLQVAEKWLAPAYTI